MEFDGRPALVTGANRGLGRHFAAQLRDRGAIVYAAARNPDQIDLPGVTPIQLDITDAASVRRAGEQIAQLAILINNAGSSNRASLLTGDLGAIRKEMDTHFFGTLELTRAVAPQLRAAAPAAVLNVLSVLSWFSVPDSGAYCAAKSAEWSLTNALRQEFAPDGIRVSALHVGYMDTDMTKGIDGPKSDPGEIAKLALDGVAASVAEIVADGVSRGALAALSGGVAALYPIGGLTILSVKFRANLDIKCSYGAGRKRRRAEASSRQHIAPAVCQPHPRRENRCAPCTRQRWRDV